MSDSEKLLAVIEDVLLSSDPKNRYDIYLTDSRIAIVCLGKMGFDEYDSPKSLSALPSAFGVPPPITEDTETKTDMDSIKEEVNRMPLDDLLRLSKKSCYYTHDEIEELRMVLGRNPSFRILSEECESKFAPDKKQALELLDCLVSVEPLRSKLAVAGKWSVLEELFKTKSKQ